MASDQTAPTIDQRHQKKLRYCRILLRNLDPNRAPNGTNRREFRWQYHALMERTQVYASCLARMQTVAPSRSNLMALNKAANAVKMSLHFFDDALNPQYDAEGETGERIEGSKD